MAKVMTKEDLIEAVTKVCDSKRQAGEAVNELLDAVTKALRGGQKVTLTGFGTFSVSKRSARTGVNPRTGAKIKISARNVPKFKAGKSLKDAVK